MPATPTGDFYAVPDPLPPGRPGSPIWAERVAAPPGALAWRILYHSRTIHDEDIAVSGLVVAPDAAPPEGGFPVIAYAHGTTGLADPCAPSKAARPLADRCRRRRATCRSRHSGRTATSSWRPTTKDSGRRDGIRTSSEAARVAASSTASAPCAPCPRRTRAIGRWWSASRREGTRRSSRASWPTRTRRTRACWGSWPWPPVPSWRKRPCCCSAMSRSSVSRSRSAPGSMPPTRRFGSRTS